MNGQLKYSGCLGNISITYWMCGLHGQFVCFGEEKNHFHQPGIQILLFCRPTYNVVTTPTELCKLILRQIKRVLFFKTTKQNLRQVLQCTSSSISQMDCYAQVSKYYLHSHIGRGIL